MSEGSTATAVRLRPVLATVVFALAGPPVGGLLIVLVLYLHSAPQEPFAFLAIALAISYPLGGIQALLTGIGVAVLAYRSGSTAFWHPLLIVIAVHALAVVLIGTYALAAGRKIDGPMPFLLVISPLLSLPSAAICWFLARPLLRAQ